MKIKLISAMAVVFIAAMTISVAQSALPNQMQAANAMERMGSGIDKGDLIFGIPLPPGQMVEDFYFDKHWNQSSMLLYTSNRLIESYYVKYDVKNELVEVMVRGVIRTLNGSQIKTLTWMDSLTKQLKHFVNAKEFIQSIPVSGLLELVVDGRTSLLKRTNLFAKKPDYTPVLDMGSRNEKLIRQESFYLTIGKKLVPVKNKEIVISASIDRTATYEFIKSSRLKIKKEEDLKKVAEFINRQQGN